MKKENFEIVGLETRSLEDNKTLLKEGALTVSSVVEGYPDVYAGDAPVSVTVLFKEEQLYVTFNGVVSFREGEVIKDGDLLSAVKAEILDHFEENFIGTGIGFLPTFLLESKALRCVQAGLPYARLIAFSTFNVRKLSSVPSREFENIWQDEVNDYLKLQDKKYRMKRALVDNRNWLAGAGITLAIAAARYLFPWDKLKD